MISDIYSFVEENLLYFLLLSPILTQLGVPLGFTFFIMLQGSLINTHFEFVLTFIGIGTALFIGDLGAYYLGKKHGDFILKKAIKHKKLHSTINTTSKYIEKNLFVSLFLTRTALIGLIFVSNYLFGFRQIKLIKLLPLLILAEIWYAFIFLGIGYFFKDIWEYLFNLISEVSQILVLLIILYYGIKSVVHHYHKHYKN